MVSVGCVRSSAADVDRNGNHIRDKITVTISSRISANSLPR
jgi:hypothetical protein